MDIYTHPNIWLLLTFSRGYPSVIRLCTSPFGAVGKEAASAAAMEAAVHGLLSSVRALSKYVGASS